MHFDAEANTLHVTGQDVRLMQTMCPSQTEKNRNLAADELLACLADLCAAWRVRLTVDGSEYPLPEGAAQPELHCLPIFAAFQEILPPLDAEAMEEALRHRDLEVDCLAMDEGKLVIPAGRVAHLAAILAADPLSLEALEDLGEVFWRDAMSYRARCLLVMRRMQAFGGVTIIDQEIRYLEPGELVVLELAIDRMGDDLSALLPPVPELEDEPGDHDHLFGS